LKIFEEGATTVTELNNLTLDNATYNCPWQKTGLGSNKQIFSNVCLWDLFIVMAKVKRIGNCLRLNLKGMLLSEGIRGSLGIKTVSVFSESILLASITF